MITRIFHPIGQGAFYSERFGKINIVYDCGCGVKKDSCKIANKVVKQSFKPKEVIDILFISHFHEDHINKIKILKEHCKIENVVLPLVNNMGVWINIYKALDLREEANLIEDPDYFLIIKQILFMLNQIKLSKKIIITKLLLKR